MASYTVEEFEKVTAEAKARALKETQKTNNQNTNAMKKSTPHEEGYLTTARVLEKLFPDEKSRPSERTMQRHAESGKLPSRTLGGKLYFKLSEVEKALATGSRFMTAEEAKAASGGELWTEYERILKSKGQNEASAFYQEFIAGKH